ncbi:MAG: fimbrial protein FimV [Rhodoferax sp.]|uniref:FimV/HubP family polar landmark protein n=1 Tax=Rhodoferax sp. TaxID=50421 RepID=UPI0013FE544C|nr:FimV/HubP family polar landmark protein [Rhodoferax sp.]NDP37358.1 fimbrial protein FimV [Rhodoferax sp.]
MAIAATAIFGLWGSNAAALSLGRISVQSALGEPLRAEIEVPEINAEEAASLKASIASPDAFRTAGLEYNPAMASLQVSLQRRADGRAYIRLSSDRAINDPFVDMILVASWATGRIVRDYTLLFDPPSLRQAASTAPTPAQVPVQVPAPSSTSRVAPPVAPAPSRPIAAPARPAVEPAQSPVKPPARPLADKAPDAQVRSVTVKSGDTASKIATATKPANVSLDQMLVALLRANPDAFIGDNVNRVKAGSVVSIPTAAQAEATPAADARQIIIAQSKDFNDFRRKLAAAAPSAQMAGADRKASGAVQAKVEDKKPLTAVPDKLTLSKGAVQGASAEAQLAQERNAKEAADRATEIAKNISDLGKLGAASTAVAPALPASAALVAEPSAAPSVTAASAPAVSAPASAAAVAVPGAPVLSPMATASAPTPAPAATPPVALPEPSLLDDMTESPLALSGALGLVALLVAFGLYRTNKRKKAAAGDSSFLDSQLQPDSFFGASGGESVDTSDNAATGSSMVYSPSQLDAVDDVDPVAEADVYLAYGRDMQAEEILKDALVSNPGRIAIHQKLLDIFAKRRDTRSFENMATQAFRMTEGQGPEWERICLLGLSIDPSNALYQPGGEPNNPDGTPSRPMTLEQTGSLAAGVGAAATQVIAPQAGGAADLDLDLDFSLDEEPVSAISEIQPSYTEPTISLKAVDEPPVLDFGLDEAAVPFVPAKADAADGIGAIEFSLPDLDAVDNDQSPPAANSDDFKLQAANSFGLTSPVPLPKSEPPAPAAPDLGMLEFDLGSLSLDLGDEAPTDTAASPMANEYEDPLVTKLALAEEFRAIGDEDGARALIEEVISEASGDMKIKAQRALSNL